jgi:hypothetical protein
MKTIKSIIYPALMLAISSPAYADLETDKPGRWSIHINYDLSSNHDAYGIAFIGDAGDPIKDILLVSLGISANEIESEKHLAPNGRKEINAWYMLVRFSGNYTVTPFFEAGFDLGDAILDDLANNNENNDSEVDYYFSLGLTYKINQQYGMSLYHKNTTVKYKESTGEHSDVDLEMIGVSGYYYF